MDHSLMGAQMEPEEVTELVDNANPETRELVAELAAALDTLILDTLGGL